MALGATFVSRRGQFEAKNAIFADMVVGRMASNMELLIKTQNTPLKTGQLRGDTRARRSGRFKWRVEARKEYAAVQELGFRRGARPFTHYTTPGTGRGWFRAAVNATINRKEAFVAEAKAAAGLQ